MCRMRDGRSEAAENPTVFYAAQSGNKAYILSAHN